MTSSFLFMLSKTLRADSSSPHFPYILIKAEPIYELYSNRFSTTYPSIHLPRLRSPKSPQAASTLTSVISSGSNPSFLISPNISTAFRANPNLEYPDIIEFHETISRSVPSTIHLSAARVHRDQRMNHVEIRSQPRFHNLGMDSFPHSQG
ncbi:genome polyprotein 2 [Striga asiatica]|uniref:Genome polyprotein 2 n=1 Tax=Striga asiatica TaxID=4170 RepID=A0A5A7NYI9_STRAF|nr:genome polyprotein 2 [Striga asiatica]